VKPQTFEIDLPNFIDSAGLHVPMVVTYEANGGPGAWWLDHPDTGRSFSAEDLPAEDLTAVREAVARRQREHATESEESEQERLVREEGRYE
jgi:hypothetical protein